MASARSGDTLTSDNATTWSSRPRVVRVLAILTAFGLVLGILGALLPKAFGDDDTYGGAEREEVISRATDFATAYNTYDVAQLDDYQKRLKGLLTADYDEEFVKVTDAVFQALKDKKQKSGEAKVRGVAIESIDDDSAETIVAVDATITNTDNKAAVVRHFRWKVSFEQVGQGVARLQLRERRRGHGHRWGPECHRTGTHTHDRGREPNERLQRTRQPPPHRRREHSGRQEDTRQEGAGKEGPGQEGSRPRALREEGSSQEGRPRATAPVKKVATPVEWRSVKKSRRPRPRPAAAGDEALASRARVADSRLARWRWRHW